MAKPSAQREAIEAAFRALTSADRADPSSIPTLVDAVCGADPGAASLASTYLSLLTPRHAEAREAVLRMAADSRWEVRERAMHTANRRAPSAFGGQLARLGLADADWRVRRRAADLVFSFGLLDLVPELEGLLAAERSAIARQSMRRALGLLGDGYFFHPEGAAAFRVEYVSPRYGLCFASVSRGEVEQRGAEAVVAALRETPGYKPGSDG